MAPDDEPTTTAETSPSQPVRRLYRSRTDKVVAGVAGGLGEYLGVDPVIVRIAFVALTVIGGSGIVLYALGWLLLPEGGADEAPGVAAYHSLFHRRPLFAIILVVIGVSMLLDGFDWGRRRHGFGWAFGLVAIGAAILISQRRQAGDDDDLPLPPTPPPPSDPSDWTAFATPLDTTAVTVRDRRPKSFITPVTVSLLLIGGGLATIAGVSLQAYLAGALLTVGLALLIGSVVGQARGLIVIGLVLTGAATLASVTDVSFAGGVGERRYHPVTASAVRQSYRLGVGELRLDLSDVQFREGRTTRVKARVGAGELRVVVPDNVDLVVDTHVGLGQYTVLGHADDGGGLNEHFDLEARRETSRTLVLDLDAGFGEINVEVQRAAA